MNHYTHIPWNPDFVELSPMYEPLRATVEGLRQCRQWPDLAQLQALLDAQATPIQTLTGQTLRVVPQDVKPCRFEEHYAPRIYFKGELQTRRDNWHDFFQLLSWILFPGAKAVINSLHIPMARQRLQQGQTRGARSALENALSLFDEGGAIILASDPQLLAAVRNFSWKELFWQRRDQLADHFQCIIFGHAMFEKGLAPYIGMTANTVLFEVEPQYFELPMTQQLSICDQRLVELFSNTGVIRKPKDLSPFPVLGMPGWYPDNEGEGFYENRDYFRPGRRR